MLRQLGASVRPPITLPLCPPLEQSKSWTFGKGRAGAGAAIGQRQYDRVAGGRLPAPPVGEGMGAL